MLAWCEFFLPLNYLSQSKKPDICLKGAAHFLPNTNSKKLKIFGGGVERPSFSDISV
jgi:hypothetical protein